MHGTLRSTRHTPLSETTLQFTTQITSPALFIFCAIMASGCTEHTTGPVAAPAAVATMAYDLDGNQINPLDQLDEKVGVMIFSRTDCPIARRYSPQISQLQNEFAAKGVHFYMVFPNPRRTVEEIVEHMAEYELSCTPIRDPDHWLVAKTGAEVTPEAVVFTPEAGILYRGRIDDRFPKFGVLREPSTHDLADAINAALTGSQPPKPDGPPIGCYIDDLK